MHRECSSAIRVQPVSITSGKIECELEIFEVRNYLSKRSVQTKMLLCTRVTRYNVSVQQRN